MDAEIIGQVHPHHSDDGVCFHGFIHLDVQSHMGLIGTDRPGMYMMYS